MWVPYFAIAATINDNTFGVRESTSAWPCKAQKTCMTDQDIGILEGAVYCTLGDWETVVHWDYEAQDPIFYWLSTVGHSQFEGLPWSLTLSHYHHYLHPQQQWTEIPLTPNPSPNLNLHLDLARKKSLLFLPLRTLDTGPLWWCRILSLNFITTIWFLSHVR